jgi:hypothetical protein
MSDPLILQNLNAGPQALIKQAVALARSTNPADQAQLLAALNSEEFLTTLDSREDYVRYRAKQLRFARIFKVLLVNDAPPARQTLVALTQAATFQNSDKREEMLVKALAVVRPAPSEAIQYWKARSTPDSIYIHFTVDALCNNGSEPAIRLLEQILIDPDQDFDFKILWMRDSILKHRNDLPLLQGCYRLLTTGLPADLKPYLVEALFDYDRAWYASCSPPFPPNRALATKEARQELRRIGEFALAQVDLTAEQSAAVKRILIIELGKEDE